MQGIGKLPTNPATSLPAYILVTRRETSATPGVRAPDGQRIDSNTGPLSCLGRNHTQHNAVQTPPGVRTGTSNLARDEVDEPTYPVSWDFEGDEVILFTSRRTNLGLHTDGIKLVLHVLRRSSARDSQHCPPPSKQWGEWRIAFNDDE